MVEALKASAAETDQAAPSTRDKLRAELQPQTFETLEAIVASDVQAADLRLEDRSFGQTVRNLSSFLLPNSAAANDDVAAIGAHVNQLRRQDGRRPEVQAAWVAAAWLVACGLFVLVRGTLTPQTSDVPAVVWVPLLSVATLMLFFVTAAALRQRTTQATLGTLLRIAGRMTEPEAVERQRLAAVPERFKAEIAALDRSVAQTNERLTLHVTTINEEMRGFAQSLKSGQDDMSRSLEQLAIERASIVTNGQNLHHVLTSVHSNLSRDLGSIAENLEQLFRSKSAGLIDVIDARNKEFIRSYLDAEERALARLREAFDQSLVRAMERHEVSNDRFLSSFARRQDDFDNKIDKHLRDSFATTDRQIVEFCSKASDSAVTASREVEELLRRTEDATEKRSGSLQKMLASSIIELSNVFRSGVSELEGAVGSAGDVVAKLDTIAAAYRNELAAHVDQFDGSVIKPLDRVASALDEHSRTLAAEVVGRVSSLGDVIAAATTRIGEDLRAGTSEFGEAAGRATDALRADLAAALRDLGAVVERSNAGAPPEPAAPPRAPSRQLIYAAASGPAQAQRAEARDSAAKEPAREPARDTTRNATVDATKDAPSEPPAPAQASAPAPAATPPVAKEKGSWISELLARVDAAGPVQSVALTSPKSIEVISAVLDRIDALIITKEVVAAWDRFREGEPSSFETIFTAEGRTLWTGVTAQIETDEVLRDFVQAYLARFELLLKEAYTIGDDGALLSYMSSSGGKVYTFLAKAIGRI